MKKKLIIMMMLLVLTTGCFKQDRGSYNNFKDKVEKLNAYQLSGELEIYNNDNKYTYDVKVTYQKEDQYHVSLKNKTNNHEQIILKNKDAVYVLTPALRKSFKFQSEWPSNNSQSYILQNLIFDVDNDKNKKETKKDKETIITSTVTYTNNPELVSQKIYLDKNSQVTKVEVLDKDDNVKIKMKYQKINYKPNIPKNFFTVNYNIGNEETTKTSAAIDNITYPMYMPDNTYLQSQDKIKTTTGERVILTFAGEKPFTLVEETIALTSDVDTITVLGEPTFLMDTIGSIGENSATWTSNDIMYYATSDALDSNELLKVAESVSNTAIEK